MPSKVAQLAKIKNANLFTLPVANPVFKIKYEFAKTRSK
jgi:hypothetical protein